MREYTDTERALIAAEGRAQAVADQLRAIDDALFDLRDYCKATRQRAVYESIETLRCTLADTLAVADKALADKTAARKEAAHKPECVNC